MNVFLAMPHSTPSDKAELWQAQLSAMVADSVNIVLSNQDFEQNFARLGGWDAWISHVATGINFSSRKPVFDMIICVHRFIGKATAQIVSQAKGMHKVVGLLEDGKISKVKGVRQVEDDNWQDGWELITP